MIHVRRVAAVGDMQIFMARQPIFTADGAVYGYELLYRDGLAAFQSDDPDAASLQVSDGSAFWSDLDTITGGKRAFVSFTRDALLHGFEKLVPPQSLVVEVLEDVAPDDEVVSTCFALKAAGYTLAVDDFVLHGDHAPLLELADIVKADFLQMSDVERRAVPHLPNCGHVAYLAEKVEHPDEFRLGVDAGYSYFQGSFFAKPSLMRGARVGSAGLNHLRILHEVNAPAIDFDRLEWLIRPEVSLVYKILRLVNSAWIGLRCRIDSVKRALLMLGERGVRRWLSLIVLADVCKAKPMELVRTSAARAFFCEAVGAVKWPGHEQDLFLLGLFSLVDAILDSPMDRAIRDLPLSTLVADTLLGRETSYRQVYELAVTYERAEWPTVDRCASSLGLTEAQVAGSYFRALERATWATA